MLRSAVATACAILGASFLLFAGCGDRSTTIDPQAQSAGNGKEAVEVQPAEKPPKPPTDPKEPIALTFEELDLGMEPDSVYQPWMMTQRVESLAGRRVRITGFMSGALLQLNNVKEFPLMREQECPFGVGGQAHHVIMVELTGKLRTSYKTGPVTVEGIFSIKPFTGPNGKTWALYHLAGERVE